MGFFQKMAAADVMVVLDTVDFRKNYYHNRNKYLSKSGNDEWFTVPVEKVKKSLSMTKCAWGDGRMKTKLMKQLKQNLGFTDCHVYDSDMLVDINMRSIRWCMDRLSIDKELVMASHLGVSSSKTELLVDIVKQIGGKTYLSGPTGPDYLNMELFRSEGIQVDVFKPNVDNHYSTLYNILENGVCSV